MQSFSQFMNVDEESSECIYTKRNGIHTFKYSPIRRLPERQQQSFYKQDAIHLQLFGLLNSHILCHLIKSDKD